MCSREVMNLYRRRPDAIEPVDISAADFDAAALGLGAETVQAALYGIRPDGSITVGMESLREGVSPGRAGLVDRLDFLVAGTACF